jgi:hypothetical protein
MSSEAVQWKKAALGVLKMIETTVADEMRYSPEFTRLVEAAREVIARASSGPEDEGERR